MSYIICVGNICDGFEFIGPFSRSGQAHDYMQNDERDFTLILLQEPAQEGETK
jgi:hypothetical protein